MHETIMRRRLLDANRHQDADRYRSRQAFQMISRSAVLPVLLLIGCQAIFCDTGHTQSNSGSRPKFKALPPAGIELPIQQRQSLSDRVDSIRAKVDSAATDSADASRWRPDVDVLIRAVRLALEQEIFYKPNQVRDANRLLDEAERRLQAANRGDRGLRLLGFDPKSNSDPQLLVGGFVSRIDDSVQPYGIVLPVGFTDRAAQQPIRVDVWLHGRGDTKTEIPFLIERMSKVGQYAPANTVVLHPFGRHCNAFKFAGETDVYEALDNLGTLLKIDSERVSIRGFSMGGAGCWHLAVHHPTNWMAANPGAGFVDTLRYQGWTEQTPFPITPSMEKLLRWYDVLPWTENLRLTKTIAYSGEIDKQKMAADRVFEQAETLGFEFPYVIGAGMGHKIDEASIETIGSQLRSWADQPDPRPTKEIQFVTYTLRYSRADWIEVAGMEEQWTAAKVTAEVDSEEERVSVKTEGVTHLRMDFSDSGWPGRRGAVDVELDGQLYTVEDSGNIRGFQCSLVKNSDGEWTVDGAPLAVRKRPGLQGPIDDAFCERFVIVLPSRPARHGRIQRWIDRETEYLKRRWSRLMRGEVIVVMDRDVTEDHIESCNLICFGDFSSNRYLFDVSGRLPFEWTRETLRIGEQTFDPVKHAPVFCFPNPKNPNRYIVVNSGMTFREFSNNSNSRQIAMLPDWAVLDVTEPDDSIYAGKITAQGFFDESWEVQPSP